MKIKNPLFIAVTGLALSLSCAHAQIVFSHDFTGGTTADLDGATTTTGGATWVATNIFDRNGDVNVTDLLGGTSSNNGAGSATLAFAPVNGNIYTAESSLTLTTGGAGDWIGFGFVTGQSSAQDANNRFVGSITTGQAWMYARENTNNPGAHLTATTDGTGWSGFTNSPRNLDMRIVLDTTGGTGNWTATWYAKDTSSGSFTEVRSVATLLDEGIDSVGLAISGETTGASLKSISLTAVPEPSTYALFAGLLALGVIIRRRVRA